jgi:hypothetical protein
MELPHTLQTGMSDDSLLSPIPQIYQKSLPWPADAILLVRVISGVNPNRKVNFKSYTTIYGWSTIPVNVYFAFLLSHHAIVNIKKYIHATHEKGLKRIAHNVFISIGQYTAFIVYKSTFYFKKIVTITRFHTPCYPIIYGEYDIQVNVYLCSMSINSARKFVFTLCMCSM